MKRLRTILLRGIILILVFCLSVAVTAVLQNDQVTEDRQDMNDPTLPELMVEFDGVLANRMSGYVRQMQTDFIRDCITPLDTTKKLTFVVDPYQSTVTSLAYEIRTCDGSRVMENRKIKVLTPGDSGTLRAEVEIASDLLLNQEYSMQLTLETNRGNVYYYTRIISRSNLSVSTYLRFVKDFVEKSLDYQNGDELGDYLETDASRVGTNFSNISITSTLNQVTWGVLYPKMYIRGVPILKDVNETTTSVAMSYEISAQNEEGLQEIYSVEEFYRMRLSSAKILLLDFHRSATQVFSPTSQSISAEGLVLGVRDRSVSLATNPDTGVTAFVQDGELWTFSPSDGKTTRVFSFRRDKADHRDASQNHQIQIVRMADNGDVDFVLYGYICRGEREGSCGVCVYHYNNDRNVVEERVFIPSTKSPEFLERDISLLSYVSTDGRFFLLGGGSLYQVNTQEGSYMILEEGIDTDAFASSATGAHAAWLDDGCIKEIEFETGRTRTIRPKDNRELRLVGFMNEDLIYGILRTKDILVDEVGHVWEGCSTLNIENFGGEVLKKYKCEDGQYLTDMTLGPMLLEFWCSQKSGQTYVHVKKDNILNNGREANAFAQVELVDSSRAGTQVRLAFAQTPVTSVPLVIYAKTRSTQDRTIVMEGLSDEEGQYFVYAYGHLDGVYRRPGEAVARADERLGVVLNRSQQYVWERGNKKDTVKLTTEGIPEVFLQGSVISDDLAEAIRGKATLLDLSGCTLDAVLYEVSAGRPVVARTGPREGILIVGYDPYNTWLYDKKKKEVYAYSMDESVELFEKAGNVFFSALENLAGQ